ncbi:MAG: hypothetical protein WC476_13540 [Phycisphaerae bacterium]|jgi:hypothetical protein
MSIADEIRQVEAVIEKLKHKLSIEEAVLSRLKAIQNPQSGKRRRRSDSLSKQIEAVLSEANGPLTIQELTQRLEAKGVTSSSKYGLGPMIASGLRKDEKTFIRLSRGLYDLKDRNNSEVNEDKNKELKEN